MTRRATTRHRPTASRSPSRLLPDHLADQESLPCPFILTVSTVPPNGRNYRLTFRAGSVPAPSSLLRPSGGFGRRLLRRRISRAAADGSASTPLPTMPAAPPRPDSCLRGRGRALQRPAARGGQRGRAGDRSRPATAAGEPRRGLRAVRPPSRRALRRGLPLDQPRRWHRCGRSSRLRHPMDGLSRHHAR